MPRQRNEVFLQLVQRTQMLRWNQAVTRAIEADSSTEPAQVCATTQITNAHCDGTKTCDEQTFQCQTQPLGSAGYPQRSMVVSMPVFKGALPLEYVIQLRKKKSFCSG